MTCAVECLPGKLLVSHAMADEALTLMRAWHCCQSTMQTPVPSVQQST